MREILGKVQSAARLMHIDRTFLETTTVHHQVIAAEHTMILSNLRVELIEVPSNLFSITQEFHTLLAVPAYIKVEFFMNRISSGINSKRVEFWNDVIVQR